MAKFSDLIAYFENLAEKHKSILHTSAEKHFFRFEIDEVLAGINRTDVNFPMLILEGYSYDFTDNKSDNLLKNRQGAFILLDNVIDKTDFGEIHNIWDKLEAIGDDILVKIKSDKRNPLTPVVRDFDFEKVQSQLIMNEIGNSVGIRYNFTLTSPMSNDVDPMKWLEDEGE